MLYFALWWSLLAIVLSLMSLAYNTACYFKKYNVANYILFFGLGASFMMIISKILEKVS